VSKFYGVEIENASISLVKDCKFVLETKPNYSQGIGNISMIKENVEK